jgi:hypothetical protein
MLVGGAKGGAASPTARVTPSENANTTASARSLTDCTVAPTRFPRHCPRSHID